jgi:hypothetical protein
MRGRIAGVAPAAGVAPGRIAEVLVVVAVERNLAVGAEAVSAEEALAGQAVAGYLLAGCRRGKRVSVHRG